jgi:hypothetical protein
MQNVSNRLCNPTQFPVEWPYDKGVVLKIQPDGHLDLPVEVMDDFRPDKPGHDAVRMQMHQYGIFLRDPTRPYEAQAIEALEAAVKMQGGIYDDCYNNLRRRAAAQGTYDPEAFEETMTQMGYTGLKAKVDALKKRLEKYQSMVGEEITVHQQHDPERTLLFLDPPKEFDSKIAMEVFLAEHPDIKKKHDAWVAAQSE